MAAAAAPGPDPRARNLVRIGPAIRKREAACGGDDVGLPALVAAGGIDDFGKGFVAGEGGLTAAVIIIVVFDPGEVEGEGVVTVRVRGWGAFLHHHHHHHFVWVFLFPMGVDGPIRVNGAVDGHAEVVEDIGPVVAVVGLVVAIEDVIGDSTWSILVGTGGLGVAVYC